MERYTITTQHNIIHLVDIFTKRNARNPMIYCARQSPQQECHSQELTLSHKSQACTYMEKTKKKTISADNEKLQMICKDYIL